MKQSGTSLWTTPNSGATNISGFSGLPGGYISNVSAGVPNTFCSGINTVGWWWTSTENTTNGAAFHRGLSYDVSSVINNSGGNKYSGKSVRCIRD